MNAEWLTRLDSRPRSDLVVGPTPLEPAHRLSEHLGVEIWLKRDDLTGRGFGGNKVRTVEYLLGDAVAGGYDVLLTGAGPRSNWAMLAGLSAGIVGLDTHLVYYGTAHTAVGNAMLAELAGARITWTGDPARESVEPMLEKLAAQLCGAGRRPYVVPRGGATPLGCLGYVRCSVELSRQLTQAGLKPSALWTPTGSCGTQAGLLAGLAALQLELPVVGVATSRTQQESAQRVDGLAAGTAQLLGAAPPASASTVLGGFLGPGYGVMTPEARQATELLAQTEGIFLDPVFGAKAMAALVHQSRRGLVEGPIVFLVTGGAPTLLSEGMTHT